MNMDKIQNHITVLYKTSLISKDHFVNKQQNEVERFVYCGIEKVNKISLAFSRLYPQILEVNALEFSLGILSRSLLMDMILCMGVKAIFFKYNGSNLEELRDEVKEYCYKRLSDGTNHLIEEVFASKEFTEEEKTQKAKRFASIFPKAFDVSGEKPKWNKKEFSNSLKSIYTATQNSNIVTGEDMYSLYSYYSKYDHLSHWTSLSSHIPFESRKGKLDLSIILMVMHLKDLLIIAHDFDQHYKILLPYIEELQNHLNDSYIEEVDKADLENKG